MFGFLGFILIFLFVIILLAFALLGNLVRFFMGIGKKTPRRSGYDTSSSSQTHSSASQDSYTETTSTKKKIFGKDEGEYVEFEEVN